MVGPSSFLARARPRFGTEEYMASMIVPQRENPRAHRPAQFGQFSPAPGPTASARLLTTAQGQNVILSATEVGGSGA